MIETDTAPDVASSSFALGPASGLGVARVLREFEALRKQLSTASYGHAGVSVGFDSIEVNAASLEQVRPGDRASFTAIPLDYRDGRMRIEFIATVANPADFRALARAVGWTLDAPVGPRACGYPKGTPR